MPDEQDSQLATVLETARQVLVQSLQDLDVPTQQQLDWLHARGLLWIKLLLQLAPEGKIVAECNVNSVRWPEGEDALARYSWPARSEGTLFKQFVVIK